MSEKKKIVVVGEDSKDMLEWHFYMTLNKLGYSTEIIDYYPFTGQLRKNSWRFKRYFFYPSLFGKLFLQQIRNINPSLVIVCYRDFPPQLVRSIKQAGVKIIHINPDALTNLRKQEIFVEEYDHYFVKSNYMKDFITDKLNFKCSKFFESYNPSYHISPSYQDKIEAEKEVKQEVLMYGNFYPYRVRMLQKLTSEGLEVAGYGELSDYFPEELKKYFKNKFIKGREKANMIYGSKVVMNNLNFAEVDSLNKRFFEVIGVGGAQVVDWKPELEDIYAKEYIDKIAFNNLDEAYHKCKRLIQDDALRIALSDYNKALAKDYTYEKMLTKVLGEIGF